MGINQKFWKGRKVLITGHTGFKGSWLSLWLQELGAIIIGVSLDPPTNPSLYEQANIAKGILNLKYNICNKKSVIDCFEKHKPEIVFHLAAQSLVRRSYSEPVETYETNVMGTLNILEGIRSINTVRAAVLVTTDKCYDNKEWEWGYRENDPMGGYDMYSSSKGAAELLIASYRNSFFPVSQYNRHKVAIASARSGNVIGGGDWAKDRLVPDIIRAFQNNKKVKVRNPNSIRPWQHVLEPLHGYIQLAELLTDNGPKYSEPWNFGPRGEDVKSVQWIVEQISRYWGSDTNWVNDDNDKHPHESNYLKLDCSKTNTKMNWHPKWDLIQTLEKIVEWHKEECINSNQYKELCLKQIKEYTDIK
jgi:CDP-glucose 4,6-dehydratase